MTGSLVRLGAALACALALGACQGEPGRLGARPPLTVDPSPSERAQQAERFQPQRVRLELRPVAFGFDQPLGAVSAFDGSGRLFVVEQTGAIRIVRGGEVAPDPFLDISALISAGGERGLLGLAFHPRFESNRRLYINYTDTLGDTVVAELRASASDPDRADPTTMRVLLRIDQPFPNHNGGHVAFGPDGYLYIASGDGGSAGDPLGNGQDTSSLLGKLLRIDVDAAGGGRPYGIPEDNPFADGGGAPEVWAYGLRNPWRFSFDEPAGKLWVADVGQDAVEEVNRAPAKRGGLNYGWNVMEGERCFEPPEGCEQAGLELPVTSYTHAEGCSVTGGYVYRGERFPALYGGYFFADYCSGYLWGLAAGARRGTPAVRLLESGRAIASFGVDERGELYVVDHGGELLLLAGRRR